MMTHLQSALPVSRKAGVFPRLEAYAVGAHPGFQVRSQAT